MAPTEEYLDGPSHVMPRPESDFLTLHTEQAPGTELMIGWPDASTTTRLRELVGNLWYGRATPA